jgi:hypothetical protein
LPVKIIRRSMAQVVVTNITVEGPTKCLFTQAFKFNIYLSIRSPLQCGKVLSFKKNLNIIQTYSGK